MSLSRAARRHHISQPDLCTAFCSLFIAARGISTSAVRHSSGSSNNATPNPTKTAPPATTARDAAARSFLAGADSRKIPEAVKLTPEQRAAEASRRAKEKIEEQKRRLEATQRVGGLANTSIFADETLPDVSQRDKEGQIVDTDASTPIAQRNPANMALRLNPHPNARARWQRKMIIRSIRRNGRLTKEMKISRTEREHLSKSSFFKTSVKKLAPLARQIAGKSIDEAILQMRFSKKKAAIEVRKHLVQAKNEAVVTRGMGLNPDQTSPLAPESTGPVLEDPAITPPLPHQNPTKSIKTGYKKPETDIYIAQAWVNRGPYGFLPSPRARGRVDLLKPPYTGISVLLKEEKTRIREKSEKEAKEIRRRVGRKMWTQLPDRPITRQGQYVLW